MNTIAVDTLRWCTGGITKARSSDMENATPVALTLTENAFLNAEYHYTSILFQSILSYKNIHVF